MGQDDTSDTATPQAGKVAPEAVVLRAQPRPVTRLNRRTLAAAEPRAVAGTDRPLTGDRSAGALGGRERLGDERSSPLRAR